MASKHMDMINKSLDEIDELVKGMNTQEQPDLSKARDDEDLSPDDVSDEAPAVDDGTEAPQDEEAEEAEANEPKDDDEMPDDTQEDEDDVDVTKSLEGELNSNENTKKALEVSEFLQELVKGLDTMISDRTDNLAKSFMEANESSNELLAKSIVGIAKGQKAVLESNAQLFKSMGEMNQRLLQVESQPTVRKSVANAAHTPKVLEKSFDASAGDKVQKSSNTLSKAQASTKLTSAYETGNHPELLNDILALEGTGDMNALSEAAKQLLGN